jgi:O-antigen/teichoic acid export membrane protein
LRAGFGFLSVSVSGLALGSLDKALVLRLGGAEIAGNYTAAYRLASLAAVPVEALATAVLPRLFLARENRAAASRLLGLLLVLTAIYSGCAGAALWWLAPLLPRVLGADFAAAVAATRILAFYVPAACLYLIGVQVLLGFERLRWRLISDLLGMLTLVGLLAWSLPTAGVVGATQAVLVTQWLLAALVWLGIGVGQWSFIKKPL